MQIYESLFRCRLLRTMIWQQYLASTDPVWKSWKDFGQILVKISGDRENQLFAIDDKGNFDHLVTTVQASGGHWEQLREVLGSLDKDSDQVVPTIALSHTSSSTKMLQQTGSMNFNLEKKGTQQLG